MSNFSFGGGGCPTARGIAFHRTFVQRIVHGPGVTDAADRDSAFRNLSRSGPVGVLLNKVVTDSAAITDADFAEIRLAGCTDDQVFELVICAAVGEATRQYEAGMRALVIAAQTGTD